MDARASFSTATGTLFGRERRAAGLPDVFSFHPEIRTPLDRETTFKSYVRRFDRQRKSRPQAPRAGERGTRIFPQCLQEFFKKFRLSFRHGKVLFAKGKSRRFLKISRPLPEMGATRVDDKGGFFQNTGKTPSVKHG
jgi:hypothetical protein